MRKQQFQVIDINTIEFKHEHYAQIIGQGSSQQLVYLSFPDNPKKLIKLSLLLSRNEVQALFDLDGFSTDANGFYEITNIYYGNKSDEIHLLYTLFKYIVRTVCIYVL